LTKSLPKTLLDDFDDCIAIFCKRLYDRMRFASWVTCIAKEPRVSIQYSARLANGNKRF
jgi:hypothetical protein